jgi:SAM-dependent methyltransferase
MNVAGGGATKTSKMTPRQNDDGPTGQIAKDSQSQLSTHLQASEVKRLYKEHDYMTAYRRHTDLRVLDNPHEAVGGLWDAMGALQFNYLKSNGLLPTHHLLDIGCGTLRGGRHFIAYLAPRRYWGIDISPQAIEYARAFVEAEGLTDKHANLVVSKDMHLRFEEFAEAKFDFLLAQSVFSHLPAENIEECFSNIHRVMNGGAKFFFTFLETAAATRLSTKEFGYPFSFFEILARNNGFRVERRADYAHPRKQAMAVATRP